MTARVPAAFHRYREALEEGLRSQITERLPGDGHPDELYRMLRYHLGWEDEDGQATASSGGKELRSTLCFLACEAVGGDWSKALPAAVALELVHNFTLVHDDIQDRDPERRHRPTVWSIWGEAQAINAGDAMLALGRLAVLELDTKEVPTGKVVEAARALEQATLETVEGQTLDINYEQRIDVREEQYLTMVEKKTGALFGCALKLGGLVGAGDPGVVDALASCGRLLGVSFQMRDDILGVWGAEKRTGKMSLGDIGKRKKSFPIVYALTRADDANTDELRRIYSQPELDEHDVTFVFGVLDSVGARDYCVRATSEQLHRALGELDGTDLREGPTSDLREVAEFLIERDY